MADTAKSSQAPKSSLPEYFRKLAANYAYNTGNSTKNLFAKTLDHIAPISSDSTIHDNACGPGTASEVLLSAFPETDFTIIATDMVPTMIDALNVKIPEQDWSSKVTTATMNSQSLQLPDATFTHSITNFSIFNFAETLACVKEINRTLKPGGQAVITTWKYFGVGELIHETQRRIRPDLPLMKYSGVEWHSADAIKEVMASAAFDETRIDVLEKTQIVTGEDLAGIIDFARGPFSEPARIGWTDEEKDKWPKTLNEIVEEDRQKYGGVKFEMWAVLAIKR